ncbi:unnamed protein product [Penicillium glandicola]
MSPPKQNILFLTSPEHGQSNVALAVAEEFLRRGEFEIHIASFKELSARVQAINNQADYDQVIHFHPIAGPSLSEIVTRTTPNISHLPGLAGTRDACNIINISVLGWKPDEYILSYRSCLEILKDVRPVVVVADPLLHLGLDAARSVDMRIVILWPVPLKDVVMRDLLDIRKKAGIRTTFPHVAPYCKDHLHLSPSFREMDYPLYVPDNVISCGPILRSISSLVESDPALDLWLKEPTILICLGSHVQAPENDAMQMTMAIQAVLREFPNMQVLWKLKYDWKSSPTVKNILGALVNSDKVMVVPWIQPEIISLLESGNIVAYIHHGGANSFFEACKAGIPQVILPQWFDTYDCPARVEWLGIGFHGSRSVAPKTNGPELASVLLRVLKDKGIQMRARAIGDLCKTTEGRVVAHDQIVKYARKEL